MIDVNALAPERTRLRSRLAPLLAATLPLLLLLAGCSDRASGKPDSGGGPAVPVTVADVLQKDVPVQLRAIGNVQAYSSVSVLSQISGEIVRVHFAEGLDVRQGDLLFTIDPRPLEAALQQAQAALNQQRAQFQQAEANLARDQAQLENARVQERRYRDLVEKEFVAREQYDQFHTNAEALQATVQAGRAAVENARASIRAAEAAVENARVQLSYTAIRSPMSGRTGNLLIHQGNVVKANDVGNYLVVINQIHPIYVAFSVPEQYLADIKRYRAAGTIRVEALSQGKALGQGQVTFVNNTVDVATGTIQLKATFPNTDNALWPGQFVDAMLTLTTQPNATVVPSQAVQTGQQGAYVFVVKPDLTVEPRPVVVARTFEGETVIERGVTPGERVVTDGQLRLFPGAKVEIKPARTG